MPIEDNGLQLREIKELVCYNKDGQEVVFEWPHKTTDFNITYTPTYGGSTETEININGDFIIKTPSATSMECEPPKTIDIGEVISFDKETKNNTKISKDAFDCLCNNTTNLKETFGSIAASTTKASKTLNDFSNSTISNLGTISNIGTTSDYLWTYNPTITTESFTEVMERIQKQIDELKLNEKEKDNNMNTQNLIKNFKFGKASNNMVHMSAYGMAIKNCDNTWVAYDTTNDTIIDVDAFNVEGNGLFYILPVAIKDIKPGDVIIHMGVPMFVTSTAASENATAVAENPELANVEIPASNDIIVVDPKSGERKIILPAKSMFGFDFVSKVVSVMDMCNLTDAKASANNPFGNMLPWLLMGDKGEIDPMVFLLMGNGKTGNFNPMMFALLTNKENSDINSWLPWMFLMNQNQ